MRNETEIYNYAHLLLLAYVFSREINVSPAMLSIIKRLLC